MSDSTIVRLAAQLSPLVLLALLSGCRGDLAAERPPQADSGFSTEGPLDAADFDDDSAEDDTADGGGEAGEPGPPEADLCDAGDEAWVKRVIPFIQGRRPDSIREVRVLASAIAQLDAKGQEGRRLVARALAHGTLYTERWKTYLYEELRVQRSGDRLNSVCYARDTGAHLDETLAAAVRDNPPTENVAPDSEFGPTISDLAASSIHLDDVSPLYRADLFARMAAPLTGGNTTREELEISNRGLFGGIFESVYLGRTTECLQCHITVAATTYDSDPDTNRHWSVLPDVNVEMSVYGEFQHLAETLVLDDVHSIFRHAGFVDYSWCTQIDGCNTANIPDADGIRVWGLAANCGLFVNDHVADPLVDLPGVPYMAGTFADGALSTVFDLEARFARGLDALTNDGLLAGEDGAYLAPDDPEAAMAFLFSLNFAEGIWQEAMGYDLTVANHFPRNEAQRDTLQYFAETFYSSHYSLREVIVEVALDPHFNQAPPDTCGSSSLYPMPALFDPFTKEAEDPNARGNGVGDMVHRYGAAVLLDSVSQAMWWSRFNRFGVQTNAAFLAAFLDGTLATNGTGAAITQFDPVSGENFGCCGAGFCDPCEDEPVNAALLADTGVYVNQFDAGHEGIDFNGLLHWEQEFGAGVDPQLDIVAASCTAALGATECATADWVSEMLDAAGGATMRDVAVAIKDRLITEPEIAGPAEVAAIESVMELSLDDSVGGSAEDAARRYVGVILNTPQFLLDGIPSRNQDPANDPVIVVPGTSTEDACNYFRELTMLTEEWGGIALQCTGDGITVN